MNSLFDKNGNKLQVNYANEILYVYHTIYSHDFSTCILLETSRGEPWSKFTINLSSYTTLKENEFAVNHDCENELKPLLLNLLANKSVEPIPIQYGYVSSEIYQFKPEIMEQILKDKEKWVEEYTSQLSPLEELMQVDGIEVIELNDWSSFVPFD